MEKTDFQSRIGYRGKLDGLLTRVCKDFNLGEFIRYQAIPMGYEDFNLALITVKGKYMLKIYGLFRSDLECERYVEVMEKVIGAGIKHPMLYSTNKGNLYKIEYDQARFRLSVMEFVEGKTFYELEEDPTQEESEWVMKQTALINKIILKPNFVYDSWAISNFKQEYEKKGKCLQADHAVPVNKLADKFSRLDIDSLPHCFVHGDITRTNTMKSKNGEIYIIDFAVANWYPRIQELAVLFCDMFFNPRQPGSFPERYQQLLKIYTKEIKLTDKELETLPFYIQMAHVMHLLRANYEKVVNLNNTAENNYFLIIGEMGLKYTTELWGI